MHGISPVTVRAIVRYSHSKNKPLTNCCRAIPMVGRPWQLLVRWCLECWWNPVNGQLVPLISMKPEQTGSYRLF